MGNTGVDPSKKNSKKYQVVSRKSIRFNDDRISLDVETGTFNFSVDEVLKCHLIKRALVKLKPDCVRLASRDFLGDLR